MPVVRLMMVSDFLGTDYQKTYTREMAKYFSRAKRFFESKGFTVELIYNALKFQEKHASTKLGILDEIAHMLVFNTDGDYHRDPLTGACGSSYLQNFVDRNGIGKDRVSTICITDVPAYTSGSNMPVSTASLSPNVKWISIRGPRNYGILDENEFLWFLEEELQDLPKPEIIA